jgi:hypothetical protein
MFSEHNISVIGEHGREVAVARVVRLTVALVRVLGVDALRRAVRGE